MNFQQEFNVTFGDRFENLQLKSVCVKGTEAVVTFLYPSSVKELTDAEKAEISGWISDHLNLEKMALKVKFQRVFVEENLILKTIFVYFENKFKLIKTYMNENTFKIEITPIDVQVKVELSPRLNAYFAENKVANDLAKHLKENFLVDFVVEVVENSSLVDEVDIDNVEMKARYKVVDRYDVEIVKEIAGKNLTTRAEYLSNVTGPRENVVVAGFMKKLERKDYIAKFGKHAGEQKFFYTFQIEDGRGKIDCVYFCPKKYEKAMEGMEEHMFLLLHGDAKMSKIGKLQLVVDKMALANLVEKKCEKEDVENFKSVVKIEPLESTEQNTMFEQKSKYTSRIENNTIVVFDIETTGLDFVNDQIIELGAVKIRNGNIVEKFSTFVKPSKRIPYDVVKLTGITNEMVEDAPPIQFVIKDFYDFTRGCVLCGHNVIGFDIIFIRREANNLGLVFENEIIDTMIEARMAHLHTSRYNLGAVLKVLGLTNQGAHRAWNDAYATAQVLLRLNEA